MLLLVHSGEDFSMVGIVDCDPDAITFQAVHGWHLLRYFSNLLVKANSPKGERFLGLTKTPKKICLRLHFMCLMEFYTGSASRRSFQNFSP